MNNEFGIEKNIFGDILNVLKSHDDIICVKIFGSRARGDYNKVSDIDLAIYFDKNSNKLKVIRNLDEVRCVLKFDVIDMNEITNMDLKEEIEKEGIIIYKR